jgi:azurin
MWSNDKKFCAEVSAKSRSAFAIPQAIQAIKAAEHSDSAARMQVSEIAIKSSVAVISANRKNRLPFACDDEVPRVDAAMKATSFLTILCAASLFTACSKAENASSSASAPAAASNSPAASSSAPSQTADAPKENSSARTINIQANDTMKFDVTSIEAKPGEELKVVLTNAGTQPKEVMGHNWVLLKAGSDPAAFSTAAATAKETEYIPESLKDQIIAHTRLTGAKETAEITFKAPSQPGSYPFLCSFPAHFLVGMKGTLTVK